MARAKIIALTSGAAGARFGLEADADARSPAKLPVPGRRQDENVG